MVFSVKLQLFLMKRGGEEIYVGPLGHNSCHLISYFEVRPQSQTINFFLLKMFLDIPQIATVLNWKESRIQRSNQVGYCFIDFSTINVANQL